jgi:hypothetical protein
MSWMGIGRLASPRTETGRLGRSPGTKPRMGGINVLLRCNFEEVTALNHGAHAILSREGEEAWVVTAPPGSRSAVEALIPRLDGDLEVETLADQQEVALAISTIVDFLRDEMETSVLAMHPADEGAVAAYFDFAHALTVQGRVEEVGREMAAVIELVTGQQPTPEMVFTFQFPD